MSQQSNAKHVSEIKDFFTMLTYRRPAGSRTTEIFCAKYLDTLPGMAIDTMGNRILRIGDAPVLWSCHFDTIHLKEGFQSVEGNHLTCWTIDKDSSCLGADDTVGVWLMREMILHGVPGLYIFHASEERGGIGSAYIAKHTPEALHGIKYAIALDRKGTGRVVTHQGGRCCSDAFADALASQLGGMYKRDGTGIFTDTANYTDLIPECTNISVGYYNEHSTREWCNPQFMEQLLQKLITLDIAALPVERMCSGDDWQDFGGLFTPGSIFNGTPVSVHEIVQDFPDAVRYLLVDLGHPTEDLLQHLKDDEHLPYIR